jgi:hypothetical protein
MRTFAQHFTDELVGIIHPNFGSIWRDDAQGGIYIKEAYTRGWEDGKRGDPLRFD